MDTNNDSNAIHDMVSKVWLSDQDPLHAMERLRAELADAQFEIEGCRNTIHQLAAEIKRLRERYHVAAEGDR